MIPKLVAVGVAALNAAYVESAGGSLAHPERFGLACRGALMTANQRSPGDQILTDGIVDLKGRRVSGLGIGSAPILSASAVEVKFGTPLQEQEKQAGRHLVEGTIDRLSGMTHVVVRSGKAPEMVLIEMRLECRTTPWAGH
jgi:hypothetical protein